MPIFKPTEGGDRVGPGTFKKASTLEAAPERRFVTGFGFCQRAEPVQNRRAGSLEPTVDAARFLRELLCQQQ